MAQLLRILISRFSIKLSDFKSLLKYNEYQLPSWYIPNSLLDKGLKGLSIFEIL